MITPGVAQLGALQGEFRPRRRTFWAGGAICAFFFAIGGMGLALLLFPGLFGADEDAPAEVSIIIGTILCLGLGAAVLWAVLRHRGVLMQVYEGGLVYSRPSKTQVFRWEDISEFFTELTQVTVNMIPAGTRQRYTVRKTSGEKVNFTNDFGGVEQIAARVADETFRRMMPRAVQTATGGGQVPFGKITVTREGLATGNKQISWAEVRGVVVELGVIKVEQMKSKSAWAKVAYSAVPNAHVFLALADRMLKTTAGR